MAMAGIGVYCLLFHVQSPNPDHHKNMRSTKHQSFCVEMNELFFLSPVV